MINKPIKEHLNDFVKVFTEAKGAEVIPFRFPRSIVPGSFQVNNGVVAGIHSISGSKQAVYSSVNSLNPEYMGVFFSDVHPNSFILDKNGDFFALSKESCDTQVVDMYGNDMQDFIDLTSPGSLTLDSESGRFFALSNSIFYKKKVLAGRSIAKDSKYILHKAIHPKSFRVFSNKVLGVAFNDYSKVYVQDLESKIFDAESFSERINPSSLVVIPSGSGFVYAGFSKNHVVFSSGPFFSFTEDVIPESLRYDSFNNSFYALSQDKRIVRKFELLD